MVKGVPLPPSGDRRGLRSCLAAMRARGGNYRKGEYMDRRCRVCFAIGIGSGALCSWPSTWCIKAVPVSDSETKGQHIGCTGTLFEAQVDRESGRCSCPHAGGKPNHARDSRSTRKAALGWAWFPSGCGSGRIDADYGFRASIGVSAASTPLRSRIGGPAREQITRC